jgi:hypothetical protein
MSRFWFSYDTVHSPFLPSSYKRQISTPGCINGPVICAIYARGFGEQPEFISDNLRQYIADGLSNYVAEPATPPGSKFYVYLKGLSQ